jgi:hypothetical protein
MQLVVVWAVDPAIATTWLMETGVRGRLADGSTFVGRGPTDRERFLYEKGESGVLVLGFPPTIILIVEIPGLPVDIYRSTDSERHRLLERFLRKHTALKNELIMGINVIYQPRSYHLRGQYIK